MQTEIAPVTQMVPPAVLVPTGMIDGILVEAPVAVVEAPTAPVEAPVEAPAEIVPAAPTEDPAEAPVVVKKRRGRPPRSASASAAPTIETRKMGRSFWDHMDGQQRYMYLSNQHHAQLRPHVAKVIEQGHGVARTYTHTGIPTMPHAEVEKMVLSMGGRLIAEFSNRWIYIWKDSELRLDVLEHSGALTLNTCDQGMYDYWREFAQKWLKQPEPVKAKACVKSFINTITGIQVMNVGTLDDDFIEGNYAPSVVSDYRFIEQQLTAKDPVGRLAVLEGVPGTGKTRLIRALICSLMDKAECILVAPNALPHLSGTQFLGALIEQHRYGKPMVLILEDADACLLARDEDKASLDALTGLLNLSDGILGATLDIRIIATTNAKIEKLDDAVLRKGRLLRRIDMKALSKEQAGEVFKRLTGKEQDFDTDTTVAEVYAAAAAVGDLERIAREVQAAAEEAKAEISAEVEDLASDLD